MSKTTCVHAPEFEQTVLTPSPSPCQRPHPPMPAGGTRFTAGTAGDAVNTTPGRSGQRERVQAALDRDVQPAGAGAGRDEVLARPHQRLLPDLAARVEAPQEAALEVEVPDQAAGDDR